MELLRTGKNLTEEHSFVFGLRSLSSGLVDGNACHFLGLGFFAHHRLLGTEIPVPLHVSSFQMVGT